MECVAEGGSPIGAPAPVDGACEHDVVVVIVGVWPEFVIGYFGAKRGSFREGRPRLRGAKSVHLSPMPRVTHRLHGRPLHMSGLKD
jgi:hypothetical protein